MSEKREHCDQYRLAEAVRQACIDVALTAYEDAGINGLCHEGRWECAVDALRGLDVMALVTEQKRSARS